ncbi:MAG TPA: hypothetical protein VE869_06455 [Gemmatimonas sp.]|nr:hypothetical protein [Gemmatimonas sp.]
MTARGTSPMSERLTELFDERNGPCVSIYMPTERQFSGNQKDVEKYRQLVARTAQSLLKEFPAADTEVLLSPLHELADNPRFWEHTLDGLAVLRAPDYYKVYKLQRTVPERAIVADSFHTKPLLRIAQSADRFHVLAVTRDRARLFQGDRYALDEVQTDAGFPHTIADALGEDDRDPHEYTQGSDEIDQATQRYFRAVDKAVMERYSKPLGVPLLLAALPQNQPAFRAVSKNAQLVEEGIAINPDALTADGIRERAWEIVEPKYRARLAGFVDDYHAGKARSLGTDDLDEIAMSVLGGRVRVLLVEDERLIPGRINRDTGSIEQGTLDDAHTDDLLDDLAEFTLRMGGEVVIVPTHSMPTRTGAAAVYRF